MERFQSFSWETTFPESHGAISALDVNPMILQREVLSTGKEQSSFCMKGREENAPGGAAFLPFRSAIEPGSRAFLWQVLERRSQICVLAWVSFLMITLPFRKRSRLSLGSQKSKIDWEGFVRIYKEKIFSWLINSFVAKSTPLRKGDGKQ